MALLVMQVSIMVKVYEQTNSLMGSASVLALRSLCNFIGGLTGSYFIDKFPLLRLLRILNRSRFVLSVIMGTLVFMDVSIMYILILYYSFTLIASWYGPCRFALISLVVDRESYMQARSSITLVNQLISTAGWGIGGVLTMYVSFSTLIWVTCGFFFLSSLLNSRIRVTTTSETLTSNKKQMSSLNTLFTTPIIRTITVIEGLEGLANVIWSSAFLLTFTHVVLQANKEWWGYINASYFIGAILGSLMVMVYSRTFQNKMGTLVTLGAAGMGILTLLFTFVPIAPVSVLLCILMGPCYQARDMGLSAIFIDNVDPVKRASISAAKNAVLSPWNAVTLILMSYMAELTNMTTVYAFAGVLYLVVAAMIYRQPGFRKSSYLKHEAVKA